MKIENVENGFAGLLMRIDGNGESLAFDNMQNKGITGTKDWEKYSITFDYPEGAEYIYVAGILVGKGEAWFDDFVVTIDGENLQTRKESEVALTKGQLDKEFEEGYLIEIKELSTKEITNLELLGRVWGFLKYHHPEIGKGNYNWDYELFRILPKYLVAETNENRNQILIDWIDHLEELSPCTSCKPTDENTFIKPDLTWIDNQAKVLKDKHFSY